MRYIFQPYPSWRYHRHKPAIVIHGPEEEPGEGWSNTPYSEPEQGVNEDPQPKKRARKKE